MDASYGKLSSKFARNDLLSTANFSSCCTVQCYDEGRKEEPKLSKSLAFDVVVMRCSKKFHEKKILPFTKEFRSLRTNQHHPSLTPLFFSKGESR